MVSFTPQPLYHQYLLDRRLSAPQSLSGRCREEKDAFPCQESNPGCLIHRPSLYRLSYPGLSVLKHSEISIFLSLYAPPVSFLADPRIGIQPVATSYPSSEWDLTERQRAWLL
jgi:hypothetical protein